MRAPLCVVLSACAAGASADITLLEETRVFDLSAQGESDFGGDQSSFFEFGSNGNDDPFVSWIVGDSVFTNGAQSAIAAASGQFLMDIDTDGFFSSGSLSTSVSILDETGYNASAYASASMAVTFSLASESLWRLTGEGTGTMLLALEDAGGSFVFFHDTSGIDRTYLLGPGEYTLSFISTSSVSTFGVGSFEDASTLTVAFVLVPGPGVLLLAGASCPLVARRRR
jgi:hypothetical protein